MIYNSDVRNRVISDNNIVIRLDSSILRYSVLLEFCADKSSNLDVMCVRVCTN